MQYRDRLEALEAKYDELTAQMADNAVINDPNGIPQNFKGSQRSRGSRPQIPRVEARVEADLAQARGMLNETDSGIARHGRRGTRRPGTATGDA